MLRRLRPALWLALLAAPLAPAAAQHADHAHAPAVPSAPPADDRTDVEAAVAATIAAPGVHVVHLWAPWCGNSRAELEAGTWYDAVEAHPDVSFSFVTIWNDGRDGADTLRRYGVPERALVYAQPDRGPSGDRALRRTTFLGLPLSWTPTTWVFNREGTLAVAFNYGEVTADALAGAIALARSDWHHD